MIKMNLASNGANHNTGRLGKTAVLKEMVAAYSDKDISERDIILEILQSAEVQIQQVDNLNLRDEHEIFLMRYSKRTRIYLNSIRQIIGDKIAIELIKPEQEKRRLQNTETYKKAVKETAFNLPQIQDQITRNQLIQVIEDDNRDDDVLDV